MAKRNGGIIGPSNVPTGQYGGVAPGVWRLRDAFNYIKAGLWPGVGNYPINNSLRFNSGSSDYLFKNSWATATSDKIFTYSTWVKRSQLGSTERLFGAYAGSPQVYSCDLSFTSNNGYIEFTFGGASAYDIVTNAMFRDISAWYHVVLAVDTTQATSSNRIKIYVNNTLQTLQTANYPPQNTTYQVFRNNNANLIGSAWNGGAYYTGYMADTFFIDGQALTPSSFGLTDSATGIWIPKPYSGTYGTNGFFLKFANSAALGTDSSGNANTFTVNNLTSVDQSTDTPTNNFATGNPLDVNGITFTEGNLLAASTGATWKSSRGTIGMSQGKWFWEVKATASASSYDAMIGVGSFSLPIASYGEWAAANPSVVYSAGAGDKIVNGSQTAYGASYTVGDIIGVAFDADNLTVTFYKNGVSQGTITPGWSANTYAVEIALYGRDGGTTSGSFNFGSPAFTISSGNADANGFGNFEYAVPSGYYALCTKNLATYG